MENIDPYTIAMFRAEWTTFDQSSLSVSDLESVFKLNFSVFPWQCVGPDSAGFDVGCGTGRWARFVAPQVGVLHCVEPDTEILAVARANLRDLSNCRFHLASANEMPFPDSSMDFGYAIGVFHYVPNPLEALRACVRKLKVGAPILVNVYYALDNRPSWFRFLWRVVDGIRRAVSWMPHRLVRVFAFAIALLVYWPLARSARIVEWLGADPSNVPLSGYRSRRFYTMRNDALNRFGNRIEHRFTRKGLIDMMERAGLERVAVSEGPPYWSAVGYKRADV